MIMEDTVVRTEIAQEILANETAALERWCKGDPDGFLEISADDVDYFDPYQAARIKSHAELRQLYDGLRGMVKVESFELISPNVRVCGDMAVLTFNFVSRDEGGSENRWNTTEVYQRFGADWRIIHSHWSYTQPKLADSQG
jgi:hypothetical protein